MIKQQSHIPNVTYASDEKDEDRRKHQRIKVPLKARFLNEEGEECSCIIVNVSAGGALMKTSQPPAFGQSVILYVDELGRFEGKVIRSSPTKFAITFEANKMKTARTADHLTQIVNRGRRASERRRDPRVQHDTPATVYFEDGRAEECAILDISLTGASIEISPRPPLGANLILGRMTAKVVRRHDKGVGVVFTGSAKRMDDVISETSETPSAPVVGAPVARSFGKKGDRA